MQYDVIVIGSGVSGMTAAIILAREGCRVLVVEQHSRPGGLMQNFRRGAHVFPTGVHRLGSLKEGQILWRYFKYLRVLERLNLVPMCSDAYEQYCFPGMCLRIPYGHDAFRERLYGYFPSEKSAIDRILADMEKCVAKFLLYNLRGGPEQLRPESDLRPFGRYLRDLGCSRELKGVLTATSPLYGIPPDECPLHTHFLVMDSFLNSSWRVDEYTTPLADAFAQSLCELGGELRCNTMVQRILCSGGQVDGVLADNGESISSRKVIFTGHPTQLLSLFQSGSFRPAFRNRLVDSKNTFAAFGLNMRWKGPECFLALQDVFLYRTWDTGRHYKQKLLGSEDKPHMVYCSALPTGVCGSYSVTALIGMDTEEMTPFKGTELGTRSSGYQANKRSIAERIFSVLKDHWPEIGDRLEIVDACTPLTYRDYTLAPNGTAYGIKKTVDTLRSSRFMTETRIKDFYLAGQSIIQPGIIGALISGVHACAVILGENHLVDKIAKETQ